MKANKNGNKELTTSVKFQNGTTNVDAPNPTKSIEHIAENGGETKNDSKPKAFLTKKKVLLAILFFVISIILVILTVRFILNLNWYKFFESVRNGFNHKWGYFWFFMLIALAFINICRTFISLIPRIKSYGCNISFGEYLLFGLTVSFLGQITPSNLITDPYTIFWMKTHGVSTSKCASLMFSNTFLWQVSQFIITFPAFIICVTRKNELCATPEGIAIFTLIWIGGVIDIITMIFSFSLCVFKQVHYFFARIFNWFKKKLHMKYHTKEETIKKYKEKATIKRDFFNYMKDWKTTLLIFLLMTVGDILGTMSLSWGMHFVEWTSVLNRSGQYVMQRIGFDYWSIFVAVRLSSMANRINFLPGAALGYEWTLSTLGTVFGGWKPMDTTVFTPQAINDAHLTVVKNGTMITRVLGGYLIGIAGIPAFIVLTIQQFRLSKKGHLMENKY